jgi:hypothetical protein
LTADERTLACPDAETIAALAEGRIGGAGLDSLLVHVESCRNCMDAIAAANETFVEEAGRFGKRRTTNWWLAAAAAIALVSIPVIWNRLGDRNPSIANLAALAPHSVRLVEPRLTGGFDWAPYRGPMRDSTSVSDSQRLRLGGAAADAIDRAERGRQTTRMSPATLPPRSMQRRSQTGGPRCTRRRSRPPITRCVSIRNCRRHFSIAH